MKEAFSILLIVMMCACGNTNLNGHVVKEDPLYAFNDFPDSLFFGLYFDQNMEDSRQNLEQNNFVLIDSSGVYRYWSQQDSSEAILPLSANLHSVKLILKSSEMLKSIDLMHAIFKDKSVVAERNTYFSVYSYNLESSSFKLSVFEQKDFIRLNFEEQARK
jgi:hypothetical protein